MPTRKALRNNLVGYVPQSEDVDWTFPVLVGDVVMMGRFGHMGMLRIPAKADKLAVENALARVGMRDFRKRQIGELSGGQKKRVFLARAIAQDGQFILLDEPFTGVDVKTEEQIISLLRELRGESRTMLVSTHNLGAVTDYCDYTRASETHRAGLRANGRHLYPENLELAFSGVLRNVTLTGKETSVLTDDERPFIRCAALKGET